MFKHHLKIIWRNILSNKLHSALNITGLAVGISSFILILLYVNNELTYDRFHKNFDNIYKLTLGNNFFTMAPFAVTLRDKVPEIEKITRIDFNMGGGKSPLLRVQKGNEKVTFQVDDIIYADSTFFDIFSFRVIRGDAKKSLSEPNSIVLTESTANKIYGKEDPIGKIIEFIGTNENPRLNYTVTAIIKDIPASSSIKFNGIVSFCTLKSIKPGGVDVDEDFGNWTYDTYVLIKSSSSVDQLTGKTNSIWLEDVLKRSNIQPDSELSKEFIAGFVRLKEVSFFRNNKHRFIWLILLVGIFIIILALINFVNLSIAKASVRTKEIAVKKVFGSGRYDLFRQFIGETLVMTIIGTSFALIIVILLLPLFNQITGISVSLKLMQNPKWILLLASGSVLTGLLAGAYPALYLSSLKPLTILKGEKASGKGGKSIIQILIVFQFIISIVLIISTIIIAGQVRYMRTESVGFDNKHIIKCQLTKNIRDKYEVFKQELLENPDIISVATSSGSGLAEAFHMSFTEEINGVEKSFYAMAVDPDFIKTIGLKIIDGRDFSWELETDKRKAVIINETAVKYFELDPAVGFELPIYNTKALVIGVVKDYHNESFQKKISPLVLWYVPGWNSDLSIRINCNNISETIQYIKERWNEFSPEIPFEFQFLDEQYDALYKTEDRFKLLIGYFSIIAILIACLGLFGLVSFSTERRRKEIGIRKINGARISEIVFILVKEFIVRIIIAFSIAVPISWYVMHKWLQSFAFRTGLHWWIFALAGLIALGITLVAVGWQGLRAATRNPVDSLRYE
jgi:putative ABC transport system permease protein